MRLGWGCSVTLFEKQFLYSANNETLKTNNLFQGKILEEIIEFCKNLFLEGQEKFLGFIDKWERKSFSFKNVVVRLPAINKISLGRKFEGKKHTHIRQKLVEVFYLPFQLPYLSLSLQIYTIDRQRLLLFFKS